jgi:hypothetical protein
MATFDYRKFLKENKSTLHASLTEGQFSWMTQDTEQQIGSERENTLPFVYMHDDKGNKWLEKNYEGYGEFGGKDYYELLDQMNGGSGDRSEGIRLAFDNAAIDAGKVLFPALTVSATLPNGHDFTKEAENDPNQSWYTPEEDDFYDQNDEEEYGYDEDEDELFEVNSKDASDIAKKFAQYMSKKEGKKFTVTPGSVDEKSFDLDVDGEKYMGGSYLVKDNGDIVNVAMGNKVSGNVNQLEEGEAAYEYEKGKKAGEAIEKKKMKKSELKAKIKEQIGQLKKGDKVNYDGEKHLVVNILDDGSPVLVPMSVIDDEAFSIDSDEIETPMTENVTTKMKKSELKAKIKEMIVAEMNIDVTDETGAYDFLAELEGMLNEAEGLTPLQDYVYQYEIEISGEDEAQEFLDDIRQLNTPQDVYDYYAYGRELQDYDVNNIFRQVKRKFANLITTDDLTPLQRRAYSYTKERFGNDEAKKSLDQIKTLKTNQEFTDWVKKKIEAENSLNEASEFDKNKPARIAAFIKDLDALVDEYHAELYLFGDVLDAIEMVKKAAKEEMNLNEAEEEVEDTEEVDVDIEDPEPSAEPEVKGGINVTQNADADLTGVEKEAQDNLEAALEAAKKLGDDKLVKQIGNSLTFFTRQHIVKENKEIFPMLKRILK